MSLRNHTSIIVGGLVAVVAFLAGRWSKKTESNQDGAGSLTPVSAAAPAKQSVQPDRNARNNSKAGESDVTDVLREPNRFTRLQQVLSWLATLDKNTWKAAYAEWSKKGLSGGNMETRIILERLGALGGAEAMETIADSTTNAGTVIWRLRFAMTGWAATDPKAAAAWAKKLQETDGASPQLRGEAWGGMMDGLCQSDLTMAQQMVSEMTPANRREHILSVMEAIERTAEGPPGVRQWIARSQQEGKDPALVADLTRIHVSREIEYMRKGRESPGFYEWVAANCTQPYFAPELLASAAGGMAQDRPVQALDWLAGLPPESMPPEISRKGVAQVLKEWKAVDPAGATAWLAAHAGHPLEATVRELTGSQGQ